MEFANGSGNDGNSNMELKSMEIVKTDNMTNTNTQNAEAVAEVQNLIRKINNLLRHGPDKYQHPEYYVDLMGDELIKSYGRECLEAAVHQVVKRSSEVMTELSTKFTALLKTFNELYFNNNPRLRGVSVEVGYWVGWPAVWTVGGSEIRLVASSEAIMVRQLLGAMAEWVHPEADPCYIKEMYLDEAGAPIWVEPAMRGLSAEQFIAAATREPMTNEEYMKKIFGSREADREVKA